MAKNSPTKPKHAILKYHTPSLIVDGQRGNMTPANMIATINTPPAYVVH